MTTTPKKKNPVDLSKCNIGQKVKLRNGVIATFKGKSGNYEYPYCLNEINSLLTKKGTYYKGDHPAVHDVVEILPLPKQKKAPANKDNGIKTWWASTSKADQKAIRRTIKILEGLLK